MTAHFLTPLMEALCGNCVTKITQYRSDAGLGARWYHEETNTEYCPGAPKAQPLEDTLVDPTLPDTP